MKPLLALLTFTVAAGATTQLDLFGSTAINVNLTTGIDECTQLWPLQYWGITCVLPGVRASISFNSPGLGLGVPHSISESIEGDPAAGFLHFNFAIASAMITDTITLAQPEMLRVGVLMTGSPCIHIYQSGCMVPTPIGRGISEAFETFPAPAGTSAIEIQGRLELAPGQTAGATEFGISSLSIVGQPGVPVVMDSGTVYLPTPEPAAVCLLALTVLLFALAGYSRIASPRASPPGMTTS